jgi:hypothetical protein
VKKSTPTSLIERLWAVNPTRHIKLLVREAATEIERLTAEIEKLKRVAEAAEALSRTAIGYSLNHEMVSEADLVELESALEDAGYGMTVKEFDSQLARKTLEDK